uniref:Thioredoxin domain-containing protein 17 n=1 Tax=Stomoxys calcitrans TaxID=35570 RepID=A0A1I8PC98_STOCA
MVVLHKVKGYEEFKEKVAELETTGQYIFILFSGGKDENGQSWCPYCVTAEPVIHDALTKAPKNSHFIHVDVGQRAYWKDLNNPFRKDPNTNLVFVPTLLLWKSRKRIDSINCSKKDLVEMIFEADD